MPYITSTEREIYYAELRALEKRLFEFRVEVAKGHLAYLIMQLAKDCARRYGKEGKKENYFSLSTCTDAVRIVLTEMEKELEEYEGQKRYDNGGI